MSTRRNPPVSSDLNDASSSSSPSNGTLHRKPAHRRTTRPSALLPTRLETLLLLIYPLTLLLGSLSSHLSPTTRNTPYDPVTQSHPPAFAPSYFARKRNIFNIYFVKLGWFWTTLALLLFTYTHPSLGPPLNPIPTPRRLRVAARYLIATTAWAAVTQWCFGPALIDRGFRYTGGRCEIVVAEDVTAQSPGEVFSHAACKMVGGNWTGGHDISGHVFLLILGSAMLWMEILPVVLRAQGLREERRVRMGDGKVVSVAVEGRSLDGEESEKENRRQGSNEMQEEVTAFGVKVALGVTALSWWMLLMTAAFFHTWFEKFTGLVVAFASIWAVYFLPRGVPALRAVIGMPGV